MLLVVLLSFIVIYFSGLFVWGTIANAVGFCLLLITGLLVINNFFSKNNGPDGKIYFFSDLFIFVFTIVLSLSLFFIFYLPIEYFVKEKIFLFQKINPLIETLSIYSLIIASYIYFHKNKKAISNKNIWVVIFLLLMFGLVNRAYFQKETLSREYLPKIYNIYPRAGIQGTQVTIKGVNFGFVWEKGKIIIGSDEANIISWSEKLVILELPVPSRFGKMHVFLIKNNGTVSNQKLIEIINPDMIKLLNFLKKCLKFLKEIQF